MAKKPTPKASIRFTRDKAGKVHETREGSIVDVFHHVHSETVAHCSNCGRRMTRSDVNDYGSLCERCYMREYY